MKTGLIILHQVKLEDEVTQACVEAPRGSHCACSITFLKSEAQPYCRFKIKTQDMV